MRRALIFSILLSFVFSQENYDSKIQPIFDANCTSCHGNSGDLNLEQGVSYDNMVNQSSSYGGFIVNPGDRGSSSLYQKLVGNGSYGSRMPQGGQLEQSYIDIIGQWIDSGAPKEFGNNTADGNPYTIDEFRISNVARTDDNTYPSAKPVSDGNTILLYHFDENDGSNSIVDASSQNNNGKVEGTGAWEPGVFGRAYDFELGSPVTFNPYNSGMVQQGDPGIADWTIDFFMLLHQFNNDDRRPIFEYDDDQGPILWLDLQKSAGTYSLLFFQTGMTTSGEVFKFDLPANNEPDGYTYIKISHASADNTFRVFVSGKNTGGGVFSFNASKSTTGLGIPSGDNSFHIGSYSENDGGGGHDNLALGGNVFSEHIELTWNPYNGDDFHQYELKHHNNDNITLGGPGTVILGPSDNASKDFNTSVWTHHNPINGMNYYKLFVLDDTFNQVAESNIFSVDFSGGGGGTGANLPVVISISGVQNGLNGQIFVDLHKASDDVIVDTKNVGETTPINNKKINFNIDQNKVTNGQSYYVTATFEVNGMVEAEGRSLDFNWPPSGDIVMQLDKGSFTGPLMATIKVNDVNESGELMFVEYNSMQELEDAFPSFQNPNNFGFFEDPPNSNSPLESSNFYNGAPYGDYHYAVWYDVDLDNTFDPELDPFGVAFVSLNSGMNKAETFIDLYLLQGPTIVSGVNPAALNANAGEDLVVSVAVEPNIDMFSGAVAGVSLDYYIGFGSFGTTTCTEASSNNYDCIIPGSAVNNTGLITKLLVADEYGATSGGPEQEIQVNFSDYGITQTQAEKYTMISVPADLVTSSVSSVVPEDLGAQDSKVWRTFKWVNGSYKENSGFLRPGSAVWIITKEPASLQTGPGKSTSLLSPQTINLINGWNQIGNPYNSNIQISSPEVIISSNVEPNLYRYAGDGYTQSNSLEPGQGYWIYSNGNGSVILDLDLLETGVERPKDLPLENNENKWQINLIAKKQNNFDAMTRLGASENSHEGYDQNDFHEPPVIGDFVSTYFLSENGDQLNSDFRSLSDGMTNWELYVHAGNSGYVDINIDGLNDLPPNTSVLGFNPISKEAEIFTEATVMRVMTFGKNKPAKILLTVGPNDQIQDKQYELSVIPESFSLAQNSPNPFNPVTNIQISLMESAYITLSVFNILGEQVNQLSLNQNMSPGVHNFIWEGKDNRGAQLTSGVYLYRLEARSMNGRKLFSDTKKMILMK